MQRRARQPIARKGPKRQTLPNRRATLSIGKAAERLLADLAAQGAIPHAGDAGEVLIVNDLAVRRGDAAIEISEAGRAHLIRLRFARHGAIDPFRGQHLGIVDGAIETGHGRSNVTVNAAESPLSWLARRKARDGTALISPEQFQAGDRLRDDFTRANLTPRVTANWESSIATDRRGGRDLTYSDAVIAARQRVHDAIEAVGPEFTGLLMDVCCFLKGLEDVERERGWPPRSAKVVLQLGLDRLARHYGYSRQARGAPHAVVRTWLAPDAAFVVE
jgi:hypothetical protein